MFVPQSHSQPLLEDRPQKYKKVLCAFPVSANYSNLSCLQRMDTKADYAICSKGKIWEAYITNEAQCVLKVDRSNHQEFSPLKLVFATRCTSFILNNIFFKFRVQLYKKTKKVANITFFSNNAVIELSSFSKEFSLFYGHNLVQTHKKANKAQNHLTKVWRCKGQKWLLPGPWDSSTYQKEHKRGKSESSCSNFSYSWKQ